jgi:hypothetical protein
LAFIGTLSPAELLDRPNAIAFEHMRERERELP